jgi:hypothetical protein
MKTLFAMQGRALGCAALFGLLAPACGGDERATDGDRDASAGMAGGGTGARGGAGGQADSAAGASSGGSGGRAGSAGRGGTTGAGGATGGAAGERDGGADAAAGADAGNPAFPEVLYRGVWFAGWAGGLDHFSWVKFSPSSPTATNGTWAVLDSKCLSCTPYFQCQGRDGLFSATPATREIVMQYPLACSDSGAPSAETWTVQSTHPAGSFPPGSDLTLSIQVSGRGPINAHRYPASQCDAGFTSCTSPF